MTRSALIIILLLVACGRREVILEDDLIVAGISFRATNNELMNSDLISEKVNRVLSLKMPNVNSKSRLHILYTDYAKNFQDDIMNKEFTVYVGFLVDSAETSNQDISFGKIKGGRYQHFTIETGKPSEVWREILQNQRLSKERSYNSDFEVYDLAEGFQNGKSEIYIGLK